MKRIVIIGTCGSGKTTLGNHLAKNLDYPVTDLDDLYWLPNWTQRPIEEFASLIEETTLSETWIICGNQSRFRHLIWPKADTIIWLDLPLYTLLWRTIRRALCNIRTKKAFCNGNYESFPHLLSRHSIVVWILKSFLKRRRDYLAEMKNTPHIKWIHAKSIKDLKFLKAPC
ncbi:shikimate kinase [Candidatus Neptunichlamydia sp. REUL1]|uniref:shikimate kinase n=1 Tax=Candidatus Neptunichlamydia sp. REUL1 TaxID=3064277 RepID=UPI00292CA6F9|nr:shikimate kinase [Candidatus Neptunochlamydia sp. REUL1]